MEKIDARKKPCPLPVVMTKEALKKSPEGVSVLVDSLLSVQNLEKLAKKQGMFFHEEKRGAMDYCVTISQKEGVSPAEEISETATEGVEKGFVVVFSSDVMGMGDEPLGRKLREGFLFALSSGEILPETIIFYHRGVYLTTEETPNLKDLKKLQEAGTEILSCGTCLDYYERKEKLLVGEVTNMYTIVEKMTNATKLITR